MSGRITPTFAVAEPLAAVVAAASLPAVVAELPLLSSLQAASEKGDPEHDRGDRHSGVAHVVNLSGQTTVTDRKLVGREGFEPP